MPRAGSERGDALDAGDTSRVQELVGHVHLRPLSVGDQAAVVQEFFPGRNDVLKLRWKRWARGVCRALFKPSKKRRLLVSLNGG